MAGTRPTLHHVQVFYPPGQEDVARRFYGEALGLVEIERPSTLRARAGLWFEAGPGHVHLSARRDLGPHPERHFALRVADLATLIAQLRARGVRCEEADPIPGWRRIYVFDPFGNKIELDEIG